MSMNRREFLPSLALLSFTKEKQEDFNSNGNLLNLTLLIYSLYRTIRFEMSEIQYSEWAILKASCGLDSNNNFTAGMCNVLPILLNPKVPKDEIWLVAFDGTVVSKITNLAVPTDI